MKLKKAKEELLKLTHSMHPDSGSSESEVIQLRNYFCDHITNNIKPTASNWGKISKSNEIRSEDLDFIILYDGLSEEWRKVLQNVLERRQHHMPTKESKENEYDMETSDDQEFKESHAKQQSLVGKLPISNFDDLSQDELVSMMKLLTEKYEERESMKVHEISHPGNEKSISSKKSSQHLQNESDSISIHENQMNMEQVDDGKSEINDVTIMKDFDSDDPDSSSSSSSSDEEGDDNGHDPDYEAYKRFKRKKKRRHDRILANPKVNTCSCPKNCSLEQWVGFLMNFEQDILDFGWKSKRQKLRFLRRAFKADSIEQGIFDWEMSESMKENKIMTYKGMIRLITENKAGYQQDLFWGKQANSVYQNNDSIQEYTRRFTKMKTLVERYSNETMSHVQYHRGLNYEVRDRLIGREYDSLRSLMSLANRIASGMEQMKSKRKNGKPNNKIHGRHQHNKSKKHERANNVHTHQKQSWKCSHCEMNNHTDKQCGHQHPELKRAWIKKRYGNKNERANVVQDQPEDIHGDELYMMHHSQVHEISFHDMQSDENVMVCHENDMASKWVVDSGASCYQ